MISPFSITVSCWVNASSCMVRCWMKMAVEFRTRLSKYGRRTRAEDISMSGISIRRRSIPTLRAPGEPRPMQPDTTNSSTIKPGAYPWGNHHNAWRPAHIHLSVFGYAFISRLVTQMYFPNDPLFEFDPIFNSVPDEKVRARMVSSFDLENTKPDWALCYRFNIVLRGRHATPLETRT